MNLSTTYYWVIDVHGSFSWIWHLIFCLDPWLLLFILIVVWRFRIRIRISKYFFKIRIKYHDIKFNSFTRVEQYLLIYLIKLTYKNSHVTRTIKIKYKREENSVKKRNKWPKNANDSAPLYATMRRIAGNAFNWLSLSNQLHIEH